MTALIDYSKNWVGREIVGLRVRLFEPGWALKSFFWVGLCWGGSARTGLARGGLVDPCVGLFGFDGSNSSPGNIEFLFNVIPSLRSVKNLFSLLVRKFKFFGAHIVFSFRTRRNP